MLGTLETDSVFIIDGLNVYDLRLEITGASMYKLNDYTSYLSSDIEPDEIIDVKAGNMYTR